jgi:N-methylhydantoinase B
VQTSDPIRFGVLTNSFSSIADEMSAALKRAAYSTNIKTREDFACALFDDQGRTIAQAFSQPVHLGSLPMLVKSVLKDIGAENFAPGDGYLINDPWKGAIHLNDMTLVSPMFYGGTLFGFAANTAHIVDVGGGTPGGLGVSTEIFQTGIIVPGVKLVNEGEIVKDTSSLILSNVRAPKIALGDFRAQIAANKLGIRNLNDVVAKYGIETVHNVIEELFDYTQYRTRIGFKELPDGRYKAKTLIDEDGVSDEPIKIEVEVTISDGKVIVDYTGSDRQRKGPINSGFGSTFSITAYPLKCFLPTDVLANEGFYRTMNVIAPKGTVVNCEFPASVRGAGEIHCKITDLVFAAFAQCVPERVPAMSENASFSLSFGGIDPKTKEYHAFFEAVGGGSGGRLGKDGMDGIRPHFGNTENTPVEELEANHPVRVLRYELIPDSEGAGQFRGGLAIRRDYLFLSESTLSYISGGVKFPPTGLFGGLDAKPAQYVLNPDQPTQKFLPSICTVRMKEGDSFSFRTVGGGGYGDPVKRSREAVLADVRDGKISLERARTVYKSQTESAFQSAVPS